VNSAQVSFPDVSQPFVTGVIEMPAGPIPRVSGVSAHAIKKNAGFNIRYGPIHSSDIPAFIDSGYKVTPEMRLKKFPIRERLSLIPMELVAASKWMMIILPAIFLLSGMIGTGQFRTAVFHHGIFAALMLLGGLVAGTIVSPLAAGKSFCVKRHLGGCFRLLNYHWFVCKYIKSCAG
jgi:hypothetical protein